MSYIYYLEGNRIKAAAMMNMHQVHRGTGFYGFPLRVGVPGEASLLEIVAPQHP